MKYILLLIFAFSIVGCWSHSTKCKFHYRDKIIVSNPNNFYYGFSGTINHISVYSDNTLQSYGIILDKKDGKPFENCFGKSFVHMHIKESDLSLIE